MPNSKLTKAKSQESKTEEYELIVVRNGYNLLKMDLPQGAITIKLNDKVLKSLLIGG